MSSANLSAQPVRHRNRLSDRAIQNLFIWPTLILLILMNVFPLFYSLYLSFTDYSAIGRVAPTSGNDGGDGPHNPSHLRCGDDPG